MDTRRLSTGDVLALGIIDKPMPKTDIPTDREEVSLDIEYPPGPEWVGTGRMSPDKVAEAVESGAVVHSEYYGIPHLWKDGDRYRGALLQYRAVTESPEFDTLGAAVEWFCDRAEALAG